MKWWERTVTGYDCESTGVDPHRDRIVSAAVVYVTPGDRPRTVSWLIDPGIPVPEEAAAVHGWSTDKLHAHLDGAQAQRTVNGTTRPISREAAIFEISAQLGTIIGQDTAVVAMNAPFDLTMLEAELRRVGADSLSSRPKGITGIVDPAVLDKAYDAYRKVKRDDGCQGGRHQCGGCGATDKTLGGLAAHYGTRLVGAHGASGDALAAVRLALRLTQLWPDVARLKLSTLHKNQVGWRAEQMKSLRQFFDRTGVEHDGCCPSWPFHGACCAPVHTETRQEVAS